MSVCSCVCFSDGEVVVRKELFLKRTDILNYCDSRELKCKCSKDLDSENSKGIRSDNLKDC